MDTTPARPQEVLRPPPLALALVISVTLATMLALLAYESPWFVALASGAASLVFFAWAWLVFHVVSQKTGEPRLLGSRRMALAVTVALVVAPPVLSGARALGWFSASLYDAQSSTNRHAHFSGGKPRASAFRLRAGIARDTPDAFVKGFYVALGRAAPAPGETEGIPVGIEGLSYGTCLTPLIKTFSLKAEATWEGGTKTVELRGRILGPVSFSSCMQLLGEAVGDALAK